MATTDNRYPSNARSTEQLRALVDRLSAADLSRSLGGGWTVATALVHLAFWDARQVAALRQYTRGDGFPSEDLAANAALQSIASAFDPAAVGEAAVSAAAELDAAIASLTAEQIDDLDGIGLSYAIERAAHRVEHTQQIEQAIA